MTAVSEDEFEVATFADFYRDRRLSAVRLAFVILGNAEAAEDVAQEALAKVERRFSSLEDPWPYTRVVVVNLCRTELRRRRREEARLRLVAASAPEALEMATSELLDAIDRLPFRQKAAPMPNPTAWMAKNHERDHRDDREQPGSPHREAACADDSQEQPLVTRGGDSQWSHRSASR